MCGCDIWCDLRSLQLKSYAWVQVFVASKGGGVKKCRLTDLFVFFAVLHFSAPGRELLGHQKSTWFFVGEASL